MKNPQYVSEDNAMGFLSDNGGTDYNLCHCKPYLHDPYFSLNTLIVWSNFEIADMDFWRSEAYMKYFEFLESKGGFYYEVSIV
jgi:alpha 1,2-mannosyltransferase